MVEDLYVELQGDQNAPVLLLHGLGGNRAVWDALVPSLLAHGFGTIAPDFSGHGRSAWSSRYSLEQHAAAVARIVARERPVRIIGHSMGAGVGLALAGGVLGVNVSSIFAVGLKVDWSKEEIDKMSEVRPIRHFATRAEAAQRFLRVTGLAGLISPDDRCVQAGLVEEDAGYRLATDPKTACVVQDPVEPLLARAQAYGCSVRLSCGSDDALVNIESLRKWDKDAVTFPGIGHNAHISEAVIIESFLKQITTAGKAGI